MAQPAPASRWLRYSLVALSRFTHIRRHQGVIQFPRDRASSPRYTAAPERGAFIERKPPCCTSPTRHLSNRPRWTKWGPGATFEFVAHLQEWALEFPISGNGWNGGLPTVNPSQSDTVWGAVFTVPDDEIAALDAIEAEEQRHRDAIQAIDRTGGRHQVATHRANDIGTKPLHPAPDYVALMLAGSRHWELPAGWILRLEDHLEPTG